VKALVTGGTGFLGAATVARLRADGVTVRVLVRPGSAGRCDADERCEGDLRDADSLARAVAGMDWVIHAGARVSTSGPWEEFEATNVRATENIIRLAVAAGVQRIVHVSSLSVYAVPFDGATVREEGAYDDAGDERGSYARSKLAADRVAQAAIAGGAPVTVVRPGLLFGPGRTPPLARRAVALGSLRLLLARRDYLLPLAYVDNVADALVLAARMPAARGRTYTVVDVHARQDDYTRLYRSASGQKWTAVYMPLGLVRAAVSGIEALAGFLGRRAPITRHQVERTLCSATFTTRRAQDELGWTPRVPLEEAMQRSFAAPRAPGASGAPATARSAA
jgi:nucleoside-diphosphate-sugar epimerase